MKNGSFFYIHKQKQPNLLLHYVYIELAHLRSVRLYMYLQEYIRPVYTLQ